MRNSNIFGYHSNTVYLLSGNNYSPSLVKNVYFLQILWRWAILEAQHLVFKKPNLWELTRPLVMYLSNEEKNGHSRNNWLSAFDLGSRQRKILAKYVETSIVSVVRCLAVLRQQFKRYGSLQNCGNPYYQCRVYQSLILS